MRHAKKMKIKKEWRNECECYFVGAKIVCFLVGRFFYLGKPSDKRLGLPDDCQTIKCACELAIKTCKEYIANVEFSKAITNR